MQVIDLMYVSAGPDILLLYQQVATELNISDINAQYLMAILPIESSNLIWPNISQKCLHQYPS